jgi:glycine cleavage system H protein
MADFSYPEDRSYTAEHEWVRIESGRARVGITSYAQDALGDIVFVTLPDDGATLIAGQTCGEVESTKSVSDLYAPVSGSVVGRNDALDTNPELVNTDPYGEGWMFEVALPDGVAPQGLMTAQEYQAQLG